MQHGLHNTLDLLQVERGLRDNELKYHYLVADPRVRQWRRSLRGSLSGSLRSVFAPRPVLREKRGVS
jgi:hypothetical protein